jgi:ABC-type glycerol-3-phosphate transport system substrate-binding protein
MKKPLVLVLAVLLVLALFAGCGDNKNEPAGSGITAEPETTAQPSSTAASENVPEPEPTEDSPYHLAADQYETDANGIPLSLYEYEEPLTTGEDVLTFWTTTFSPQYIPEEGFDSMPNVVGERERTGVNVEYIIVGSEMRFENLAVLLASDDLPDVLSQALIFIGMSAGQAVSDGYLVNLYDYRAYMPNYLYYANNLDANTKANIQSQAGAIYAFYALFDKCYTTMGYMAREDWLNKFDLTHDDIVTIDDAHNMLTLFKTQIEGCQWPMEIISSVDVVNYFSCFDTQTQVDSSALPTGYIVDGQVVLPHSGPNDLKFVETISQWFSEDLIDPNWASYLFTAYFAGNIASGATGFTFMQPSEVDGYEGMSADPNAQWSPVKSALLTRDQTLHFAYGATNFGYGHSCIAARCENIPLAVSWCDWRYSPAGSFFSSSGE